jgi:putative transcriptional regulator
MINQMVTEGFHYKMCGLDNIYLANGFEVHDTSYGDGISITDVDGLHLEIAKNIIYNGAKPSGKEIRFLRKELSLTQAGIGLLMGIDGQTVARWEKEQTEIPGPAIMLLRLIVEDHISKDELLGHAIKELTALDDLIHKEMTFHTTADGWKAAA